MDTWFDIVSISAGSSHVIGLKPDGTLFAAGRNDHGECDVYNLYDIVAIGTGYYNTLGLKSDGTVVATGDNKKKQREVSDWTNIQIQVR